MEFSVQNGRYHNLDHVVRFLMEVWELVIGDPVTRCNLNPLSKRARLRLFVFVYAITSATPVLRTDSHNQLTTRSRWSRCACEYRDYLDGLVIVSAVFFSFRPTSHAKSQTVRWGC